MVDTTLGDIWEHIEALATEPGEYYLAAVPGNDPAGLVCVSEVTTR